MADLAPVPRVLSERAGEREFLVFVLAGERYGVEVVALREIVGPPPITPVPRAPHHVLGVCSVRGLLITVIDLRRKFGLPELPIGRRSRILLIVGESGDAIGLLVDEVRHVTRLLPKDIELAAGAFGGDMAEHVLGVGRPDGEFLVLLNLNALIGAGAS